MVKPEEHQKWKKPGTKSMMNQGVAENVPLEPPENHKPPQQDFNIKGFLIEMRNKNEKVTSTIDYPRDYRQNNNGEIAMIIEENSPIHENAPPQ